VKWISFFAVPVLVALATLVLATAPALAQGQPGQQQDPSSAPQGAGQGASQGAGPGGDPSDQGDQGGMPSPPRAEPTSRPPDNPLEVSDTVRARIGTDSDLRPPSPEGQLQRSYFPYYEEKKGDYRFRFLPPLYLEHTRGLPDPSRSPSLAPLKEDRESLFGLLYYQRRSEKMDADVVFPLAWRVRDRDNHVFVLGPIVHREAPQEHDNWLAPIFFEGSRKDGYYFHSPLLLTTTHNNTDNALTIVGPYFRDRTKTDVDTGVAPFFFRGDNGSTDGTRKTYTLAPPLLFYHKWNELESSQLTVIGPVISKTNPKRDVFDIAPLFFHISGNPETGGIKESHTTVFPLFHYGKSEKESLFVLPGYLRRITQGEKGVDTMITPLFTHATTRNGATAFTAVGPVVPLFFNYRDSDVGLHAWAIAPLYFQSDSPKGHDFLTPLVGKFETYGQSRTWWFFPNLTVSNDLHGWETDLHPIVYVGRSDKSAHTVLAPIFWDFASQKGRTTIGFPFYWRFADTTDDSVVQVAGNTLYMQKKAVGGTDWQFHLLPLFSYGESPQGYWWNVLFGLAGYDREGSYARIKAFWIPIQVAGPDAKQSAIRF
jgi:hypothetical protein